MYEMKRIIQSVYRVFLRIMCRSSLYYSSIKTDWCFTPFICTVLYCTVLYCMYAVLKRFIAETCYLESGGESRETRVRST